MSTRESMCTPPLQEGLPTAEPMHMSPTCAGGLCIYIYIYVLVSDVPVWPMPRDC